MKIAIIGAGPGGLYAALAAAKQNIQVDLFEKEKSGKASSAVNASLIRWGSWRGRAGGFYILSMKLF